MGKSANSRKASAASPAQTAPRQRSSANRQTDSAMSAPAHDSCMKTSSRTKQPDIVTTKSAVASVARARSSEARTERRANHTTPSPMRASSALPTSGLGSAPSNHAYVGCRQLKTGRTA